MSESFKEELSEARKQIKILQEELYRSNKDIEAIETERINKLEHINKVLHAIRNVNQLIVKEKNIDKLITEACKQLVKTRGYLSAWISLFDEKGDLKKMTGRGVGKELSIVEKQLKQGIKVYCQNIALKNKGVKVIDDRHKTCKDCPLSSKYAGEAALVRRLEHEGTLYGTITVLIPQKMANNDEEQDLFREVSGDISYALDKLATEAKSKAISEELKHLHDLYALIVDNSPNPMIVINPDSSIDYANTALRKLTGFSSKELVGKKAPYPFWPETRKKEFHDDIHSVMRKVAKGAEELLQTKNGVPIWVQITSIPIIHNGELKNYIENWLDITKRKIAEEELKDSEEKYRRVINTLNEGIWELDAKGNTKFVNPRIAEMLGYTIDEMNGRNFLDFMNNEWKDIARKRMQNRGKGLSGQHEFVFLKKDNEPIYMLLNTSPIYDENGNFAGTLTGLSDITNQKKSEKVRDTIFNISRAANTIEDVNHLYIKIRDFLSDIIDTKNLYVALYNEEKDSLLLTFKSDQNENYSKILGRRSLSKYVVETGKPLLATRQVMKKLAGKGIIELVERSAEIWLGVPLKFQNRVIGLIAVQNYDDPHHFTENDLRILNFVSDEIAHAIRHMESVDRIKRELEENKVLLDEIHHRVKNNLQTLLGLLQLQQKTIKTKEDAFRSFQVTQDRILAMAEVYNMLLKAEYMSEVSMGDYIKSITEQLKHTYDNDNKITLSYDLDKCFIDTGPLSKIGLIINELITNSIKYAFVDSDTGNISVALRRKDNKCLLSIEDNGRGIPDEVEIGGDDTFGLSLVEMMVQEFHGTIKYDTNDGTKVTIEFPIKWKSSCERTN